MTLDVLRPGLLSTFQDLGRQGHQAAGLPVCGAMDGLAHRLANRIVGNPVDEATLEITLTGPALRFGRGGVVALAGADLAVTWQPDAGGAALPVPLLQAVALPPGATLQFGERRRGLRAYLALAGGYGLPAALGSRSTYLRGALGGHRGRALKKGDRLTLPKPAGGSRPPHLTPTGPAADVLLNALLARGAGSAIRLVEGPEWAEFTPAARAALLGETYRIGQQSDRMGYRLEGPVLARAAPRELLSEPVAFGTVQVPADGQPIVLMADRQTTGGYPRIAQVAGIDLPLLAQRLPGEPVRFERIPLEVAQRLLLRRAAALESLARALQR